LFYRFFDFAEENVNTARVDIGMLITVVNQHAQLFASNFLSSKSENEEERVDDVGLAAAVGTNHSIETLNDDLILIRASIYLRYRI
jgi:hypothetical protein